ncbi:copper resistance protein CopD [Massilia sp. RP-1-19]|uniref:Copper resistance protein CopD n=1 Tax=Massilia polaris TaxID=2728846 RepID=A0A848HIH2_9BURK|nr:CopD family protein [Massilia polaris]NML59831.1 copper resistance protein CopD [Massilia polaris]
MALDLPAAQVAATVVLNLSMAALTGASLADRWLHASSSHWAMRNRVSLRRVGLVSVTTALLTYMAALWLEAASMAEVALSQAAPAIDAVLTATHYGFSWKIGLVALAVVTVVTTLRWSPQRGPVADLVRLAAIGAFMYTRSMVSHAGAGGDISWAMAADWIHLVLISVWVGDVLVAGFVTLRHLPGATGQDGPERAQYTQALSNSATIALAGIAITGLISAWRGLGSLENITGNPYATVLLLKLALVAIAAALGGLNRFVVMPRLLAGLRAPGAPSSKQEQRFVFILQVESLVLAGALVFAAVLSSTSPPGAG